MPIAPGCRSILTTGRTAHEFRLETSVGTVPSLLGVIVLTFFISHALPGDPAAYLRGAGSERCFDRQHPSHIGVGPPASRAVPPLCQRPRARQSRQLADNRPTGVDRSCRTASRVTGIVGLRVHVRGGRGPPTRRVAATSVNGPVDHACRALVTVAAAFPTFFVGLLLVYIFYYPARMGAAATRPPERDRLFASADRHRRLHGRRSDRARLGRFARRHWPNWRCRRYRSAFSRWPPRPHHPRRDAGSA